MTSSVDGSSHWCCCNRPCCGGTRQGPSGLRFHCRVSRFVDHSSALQLSHHTFKRNEISFSEFIPQSQHQIDQNNLMFSRFGNKTNGECVAWVSADQYSIPGGSLPVTETAYTPGLKLPVVNKGKHSFFGSGQLQVHEQTHDEAGGAYTDVKVVVKIMIMMI